MSRNKNENYTPDDYSDQDFEEARQTLHQLVLEGREAVELAMEIARESEHPRAVEVLSGLLKNVAEINDKFMDLHKKKNQVDYGRGKSKQISGPQTQNNYLIAGSTAEIQKMLMNQTKDITPHDEDSDE